jgi:arylsulfatase A-like enzyme
LPAATVRSPKHVELLPSNKYIGNKRLIGARYSDALILSELVRISKEECIMAKARENGVEAPGFLAIVGIAGLIGLVMGLLLGVWDSVTVVDKRTFSPWIVYTLREMLSLSLYASAIYALIGCLVMGVIGVVTAGIIRIGGYRVNKAQLAGVFICTSVLMIAATFIGYHSMSGNIIDIIETVIVCVLSGMGLAALSIYALNMGIRKEKLIALSISLLVSIVVLLLGGLWINWGQLYNKALTDTVPVLADIGLLLVVSILGVGLYILSVSILHRYNTRRLQKAGGTLLIFMLAAFVAISFTGPYGFDSKAGASQGSDSVDSEGMPNILWIVMDTVRVDGLSCYGYHRNTTPNIDEIADEGILYENAIAQSGWTLPSHASMFTGTVPSKHGTDWEHSWLDDSFETIAEVLSSHGYQTFEYTNNRLVGPLTNLKQGFNTWVVRNMGINDPDMWSRSVELPDFLMISRARQYVENEILLMDDGAQRTNEVVTKWIADAHQREAPFFLFINYMEAHFPYHPPEEYAAPYMPEGASFSEQMGTNNQANRYLAERGSVDLSINRALYDGEISYLDYRMGQLFEYLRELDILDNTVLIITSDHGELFGEHQLVGHMFSVHDQLIHVPLIIRYPGLAEAGLRVEEQVQLIDIFPTILDIVDINWSGKEQLQGQSLVRDWQQTESTFAIAELAVSHGGLKGILGQGFGVDASKYARRLKTIRTKEYKYIWASDGRDELYNIREDPGELNNLIELEPEKAAELKALLKEWLNSFETYRPGEAKQIR